MAAKEEKVKELIQTSNEPGFWNNPQQAKTVLETLSSLKKEVSEWEELELLLMALEEKEEVSETKGEALEKKLHQLELKTFLKGEFDAGNALITIMSGAGGHDAQDWGKMLLFMYEAYAKKHGWEASLLHESYGELGGIREAVLEIKGTYAYGFLKKEAGVHRLVRISPFSAKKLRHTSFALVDVLPELTEIDKTKMVVPESDLRIDLYRASGPGGQNVNRRETAVRITHIPTGLVAASQSQRSQMQNREKAFQVLYAKLHSLMQKKQKDTIESLRGEVEIEWGHQIRSYVLDPYKIVKDHRTGVEISQVEEVLAGNMDSFIEAELKIT